MGYQSLDCRTVVRNAWPDISVREILHLPRWLVLVRPLGSFIGWKPPRGSVTWHEEFSGSKSAAAVNQIYTLQQNLLKDDVRGALTWLPHIVSFEKLAVNFIVALLKTMGIFPL